MSYFGKESRHVDIMAAKVNKGMNRPFDYERDDPQMKNYIPKREDGVQFYHPSELAPTLDPVILSIIDGDTETSSGPISRLGGATIRIVEACMTQPIEGEPTERFKRIIGGTVILAASAGVMFIADRVTGNGYNPIDYAIPFQLFANR